MGKICFTIFITLLGYGLVGQNTFSKVYDFDFGSDNGATIIKDSLGYFTLSIGSVPSNNNQFGLKFMRVDQNGSILWQKTFGSDSVYLNVGGDGCVTKDDSGNFYVTGAIQQGNRTYDAFLFKCSSSGDSLWLTYVGDDSIDVSLGVYFDAISQSIYCVGYADYLITEPSRAAIWEFDTSGGLVAKKEFSFDDYDGFRSIYKIEDTILVSGKSYVPGKDATSIIVKVDSQYNLLERKIYGTNGEDSEFFLNYSNNQLIAWGYWDTISTNGVPVISRLTNEGASAWTRFLESPNYQNVMAAKTLPDRSVVYAGHKIKNGLEIGWIGKLDSMGNDLWSRTYSFYSSNPTNCSLNNFAIDNGQIVAIGYAFPDPNDSTQSNSNTWILKLDSMGCLIPGCDTIVAGVNDVSLSNNNNHITVFPNPTHSTATVVINQGPPNGEVSFALHNLTGQQVQAKTHRLNSYGYGEWQIDCSRFSPGIYFYQVTYEKGVVGKGKLLVE